MKMTEFGKTQDGKMTHLYTMDNGQIAVKVTDYGASLVSVAVPDREGQPVDIVLGFDDVKGYEQDDSSIGCNVGRCANRISGASFCLHGTEYLLDNNEGKNTLHSGFHQYSDRMWKVEKAEEDVLTFSLVSPHLDQGFPGNLTMFITYTLLECGLKITYDGTPDRDTIINMTNHSYFNLSGEGSGRILGHKVRLHASHFTPLDEEAIPTGEIAPVEGTVMDFREEKSIGQDLLAEEGGIRGYNDNYVLDDYDGTVRDVVWVQSPKTGICMTIATDLPGLQMYTADYLETAGGRHGHCYGKQEAVCFEPQFFPDAIHKKNFVSPVCRAGDPYHRTIEYRFSTIGK